MKSVRETKEKIIQIHKEYIEEYMFGSLRNLPPSEGFRIYVDELDIITVNPKHNEEVKDNIVAIHDVYLEFCDNYRGCIGCPYQKVGSRMGACFEPFVEDHIQIETFETMVYKVLVGLGTVIVGIIVGVALRRYF